MSFFTGMDEYNRVSNLRPNQEPIQNQLVGAATGPGAGGAYGNAADYWYQILMDNPELMKQFEAPFLRQFNEQTIPDLAEQFAGMGSGALSSSGFRNAAVNAGADLSERLAAIRANLKNSAAQGLFNTGNQALQPVDTITHETAPGFLDYAAPIVGAATGGISDAVFKGISNKNSIKGKSSPYGGKGTTGGMQGNSLGSFTFGGM